MCGRFALTMLGEEIADACDLPHPPLWSPRFNIAPTQTLLGIIHNNGGSRFANFRWGLIPSWAKDPKIASKLINARSETSAEKPSFRKAFAHQRCLILTNGYYEWQRTQSTKVPHWIGRKDQTLFAMGGLWEEWRNPHGEMIRTCTILTTEANKALAPLHHRMPVVIEPPHWQDWLDTKNVHKGKIQSLCGRSPVEGWVFRPVSTFVNNARNEGPQCQEPFHIE